MRTGGRDLGRYAQTVQHAHAPDQVPVADPEPAAAPPLPVGMPQTVLALQRSAGNRAVGRMLARREVNNPTFGKTPTVTGGDWLDTDRKSNTQRWKDANEHNLLAGAFWEYKEIEERRDFYRWFYEESTRKGIEARWALAASIVAAGAGEMAHMSGVMESMGRITGASSNEVQAMMRTGNQVIFDNVFPKLKKLWTTPLTGQAAVDWDAQTLAEEQNMIQPLYKSASTEAQAAIEAIAKGGWQAQAGSYISSADWVKKGNNIKEGYVPYFTGDLLKPEDRWQYGMKLAGQFSTLSPGTVAVGPAVGVGRLPERRGAQEGQHTAERAHPRGDDRRRPHERGAHRRRRAAQALQLRGAALGRQRPDVPGARLRERARGRGAARGDGDAGPTR